MQIISAFIPQVVDLHIYYVCWTKWNHHSCPYFSYYVFLLLCTAINFVKKVLIVTSQIKATYRTFITSQTFQKVYNSYHKGIITRLYFIVIFYAKIKLLPNDKKLLLLLIRRNDSPLRMSCRSTPGVFSGNWRINKSRRAFMSPQRRNSSGNDAKLAIDFAITRRNHIKNLPFCVFRYAYSIFFVTFAMSWRRFILK